MILDLTFMTYDYPTLYTLTVKTSSYYYLITVQLYRVGFIIFYERIRTKKRLTGVKNNKNHSFTNIYT